MRFSKNKELPFMINKMIDTCDLHSLLYLKSFHYWEISKQLFINYGFLFIVCFLLSPLLLHKTLDLIKFYFFLSSVLSLLMLLVLAIEEEVPFDLTNLDDSIFSLAQDLNVLSVKDAVFILLFLLLCAQFILSIFLP